MDPKVAEAIGRGNPVVFFDVAVAGAPIGRIRMEMCAQKRQKTFVNFVQANFEEILFH
jgi:hypothetical protein